MSLRRRTLEQIVTACPPAAEVLLRRRLDFCLRGRRTLADACAQAGLDLASVVAELLAAGAAAADRSSPVAATEAIEAAAGDRAVQAAAREGSVGERAARLGWTHWPLDALIDHVVEHFHRPLRADLEALVALARAVAPVRPEDRGWPRELPEHLERIEAAIASHLAKEEQILFPLVREGRGETAYMPIKMLMQEHDDHGEWLRRTRALCRDYLLPAGACASWHGLYRGLVRLEAELCKHVHLENYVLFPRATQPQI